MEDQEVEALINRKKKYLKRYKKAVACIARLEGKYQTLTERIKSVKSPNYSGMPRGGVPVTTEELIADKLELEERIKRLKKKSRRIKSEIIEEIDTLEDPLHCEILEAFFIDCLSIEDIADNLGYTDRHIYRMYNEAVSIIAVKCQ